MSSKAVPTENSATAALLSTAVRLHQAGDLAAAEAQYQALLERSPDHAEALYLSGALAHQMGASDDALRKLSRSLALRPGYIPAVEMLGAASAKAGKFEDAARCFGIVLAHKPTSPDTHYHFGHAQLNLRSYGKAEAALRQALKLNPAHGPALYLLAVTLRLQRRLPEAAAAYVQVLDAQPNNANALDEYGGVLFDLGRVAEAEEAIRRAIVLEPAMANPYTNLGRLHQTDIARAAESLALHEQALAREPNYADAHNNRGVALQTLGRFDDAIVCFQRAIALKPTMAEAHNNLGNTHYKLGNIAGAVNHFQQAIALNPAYAEAHWNKALAHLTRGDFGDGWAEYEWRWNCTGFEFPPRNFRQPAWRGEDLGSGGILVWGEQGIGDEILYGSMVGDLITHGFAVTWEADPRFVPLLQRSYPGVHVIARTTPPHVATAEPSIRAQIPTASLGQYLRRDAAAFPSQRRSYLQADKLRSWGYRARLLGSSKTRLIGISWISKNPDFGVHKTMRLEALAPLWQAAGPSAQFVDLQYADTAAERAAAQLDLAHLEDLDLFNDIDGLAALVAACDMVITVSNTTAHLAGALGVPVWVMAPNAGGKLWYWGGAPKSLWYPSATIFKNAANGSWDDVIAIMAQQIADLK